MSSSGTNKSNAGGGGIGSRPHREVGNIPGSRTTNRVSPGATARIGIQEVRTKPHRDLLRPAPATTGLGNEVALNVGRGGPGTGRKVYDCGTQGRHDGKGER